MLILDVFYLNMQKYAVEWTEWIVHTVLFWETDNAKKGRILRAIHHAGVYALLTLIIVSHTIYPAFWLQTILLAFCFLVWVQHILTHGCVISKVEQKLIGDESSFLDPFLELYQIEASEFSKQGILTLGSSLFLALLSLEWISRVFHKIIPFALAQFQAVSSAVHIPLPKSSL
jgi:hypothetical protein